MRRKTVYMLEPGDVLSEPVRNKYGNAILEAGTQLTEHYIRRLKEIGVKSVTVKTKEIAAQPQKSQHSSVAPLRPVALATEKEIAALLLKKTDVEELPWAFSSPILEVQFRTIFRSIIVDLAAREEIMKQLKAIYDTDQYIFEHSIRVAVLAGMVGLSKQYSRTKLNELTLGALLFDIGMTSLPTSIIKSRSELTGPERRLLEHHTIEGYRVLISIDDFPAAAAKCALLHHERFDGSGYPMQFEGTQIPEYAQIVAMADVYDALISPRHHRRPYTVSEATEYMFASGNKYFEADLVRLFHNHICGYPVSTVVRLSSGQIGIVTSIHRAMAHRPVVKIVEESDGIKVTVPYEVDLKNDRNLVIVDSILGEQYT
ncbi:HD domain-containing protein [Paenibacillus sp. IB182496]|uniref:HD domain-containing protein n=1 Tax=Paenibacillus sabuli TaxID=2772509 RepID=A0A927BUR4_9BACL|nr:HD domain-containing phosphohydrolase [Paenibacillus sabuli]MBD2845884.1 HD domain-containing protein [Paenibacillus sabuli]